MHAWLGCRSMCNLCATSTYRDRRSCETVHNRDHCRQAMHAKPQCTVWSACILSIHAVCMCMHVQVWRLPAALSDPHKGEERLLKRVAESDDVGSCLK